MCSQVQVCVCLPVDELVLLQVLAASGDVPGHIEEIHHGQTGRVVLIPEEEEEEEEETNETQMFQIGPKLKS